MTKPFFDLTKDEKQIHFRGMMIAFRLSKSCVTFIDENEHDVETAKFLERMIDAAARGALTAAKEYEMDIEQLKQNLK